MGRPWSGGPRGNSRGPLVVDGRRGGGWSGVHGGVKFYRGAPKAARAYVEQDCARYDDYYLTEGDGIAMRFAATRSPDGTTGVARRPDLDGAAYEAWVAGINVESGEPK